MNEIIGNFTTAPWAPGPDMVVTWHNTTMHLPWAMEPIIRAIFEITNWLYGF